ncbi:MAG TPA: hypothetical protein VFW23_12185 [Tepidisphaeraceae bacterium]|nr:hypothetical protein [Tepidisphaeraceae bacterium]
MPQIVDYPVVLDRMTALSMKCLYYNSGAFGPADHSATKIIGWIGGEDPTIRPDARAVAKIVQPPIEKNLAQLVESAWKTIVRGPIWFMPKSHWAFELDFGNHAWLSPALEAAQVDWKALAPRTNASAVEFGVNESDAASALLQAILTHLVGSDFALAWPSWPVACTIHHHKQLWWTTSDVSLHERLGDIFY